MKTVYSIVFLAVASVVLSFSIGAFYAYFYPMKYKEEIIAYGSNYGIDAGLIASVANVESGFNESSISNKGAIGVMQLMPSTAQWIAEKLKEDFSEELLFNGEYNIKLGTYYLSYLLLQFGNVETALCAYNAGPGNVKNWLKDSEYSSDGERITKIPFEETRNYLNRVLKNYNYYGKRYKNLGK